MDFILLLLSPWVCAPSVTSVASDSLRVMDCSPLGSSVHGVFQARILEGVAMPSSKGSSQPRDFETASPVSPALADRFFTTEPPGKPLVLRYFSYFQAHKWFLFQWVPSPHPLFVFTLPRSSFLPLAAKGKNVLAFYQKQVHIFFV